MTRLPILLLLLAALNVQAAMFSARVIGVHDGDTFTVLRNGVLVDVRISAVDCPEKKAYFGKGGVQPFGKQAAEFTERLLKGKVVALEEIGLDRNRIACIVTLPDGRRLGREILAAGYGWLDPRYSKDAQLLKVQEAAKKAKHGLWVNSNPVEPWVWRKRLYTGKVVDGRVRIAALLPNPSGEDWGNEQVTLVNVTNKPVSLRGWSLWDKARHGYGLSGTIPANGRLVITMRISTMSLNNDGDTITLLEGDTARHQVSYTKKQVGSGVVVKVK